MDKPRPQVIYDAVRSELVHAQSVNGGSNPDTTTIDTDTNTKYSTKNPETSG